MDLNTLVSIAGIIVGIIGVIIAILTYIKKNEEEFNPVIDAKYSEIIVPNSCSYNHKTNLSLNIETWTPHLSKVNIKFVGHNLDKGLDDYLDHGAMAKPPYSYIKDIEFSLKEYTYSIDQRHYSKEIEIPIEIQNLWISFYKMSYPTSFKIGDIMLKIELKDCQNKKTISRLVVIPVNWMYK
jgi:hypothetical protein